MVSRMIKASISSMSWQLGRVEKKKKKKKKVTYGLCPWFVLFFIVFSIYVWHLPFASAFNISIIISTLHFIYIPG